MLTRPSKSDSTFQGYILEASPLPKLPVTGFRSVGTQRKSFDVILDYQSREDEAVNGTETEIKYDAGFPRYPLVLLLDGIVSCSIHHIILCEGADLAFVSGLLTPY